MACVPRIMKSLFSQTVLELPWKREDLWALEIVLENDWKELNICFDSKSNLEVIKSSEEVYRNTIIKLGWTE
ncbi:uncharacterized protein LOC105833161 isoform X4 [Monomorium pharaonis]|uniref:uncharacterized protein LOC105833161 isoform X4 n=1 Tax=Monomorium pharaonis TaxID=307658 RepID=UPI001747A9D4|nr:uncharacterized protein LOC105833161 isoform X4 [Monomorium pharaonis]XP_036139446.1 uncharacterized protein LOC105833161 isoform X4 [Monomorium pharaonis]